MSIEICQNCKGAGFVEYDIGTHNSKYSIEPCIMCNATGRVVVETIRKVYPFKPSTGLAERKF